MQPNLQATTFNKHNRIKDEYKNYRRNQFVNNVSSDLSFHAKSITNIRRNAFRINAGDEYLYVKRIENLKRMLNNKNITYEQYIIAVQKIELKMFGQIITHPIENNKPNKLKDKQKSISKNNQMDDQLTNNQNLTDETNIEPENETNINEQLDQLIHNEK